ncbi:MAG: SurA N-terminal domain-containing protein [Thermodesulfobacteriota bacterium]|nr:SurA N-terminal domain-containing protein [Thermodesulfobacteriota bacterium]
MLGYIRRRARGWITKVIFGVIIVVFIFWGGSTYFTRKANKIAQVDNHIISIQQHSKAYRDAFNAYQERYGKTFDNKMAERMNLRQKVLEQMINNYIMEFEAKRVGIIVTDEELAKAIKNVGAFTSDGKFDMAAYNRVLRYYKLQPGQFEDQQKKEMLRRRLQDMITGNVSVTPKEIEASFRDKNDRFDLNFVRIKPSVYEKEVDPAPEEIEAYYEAHKQAYKVSPKTSIAYISFDAASYIPKVDVTVDEASAYYDAHKQLYTTPAKVRARHILIRIPEQANDKAVKQKEKEVLRILEEAKSGKSFESLAKKYSQDPGSAARGGDLGFLKKDDLGGELGNVLFSMKPGEIRGPVKTMFGFHIVKVEEKKDARTRTFDVVKQSIMETLKKRKAKDKAYNDAYNAFVELYEDANYDIHGYGSSHNLKVKETSPFTEKETIDIPGGADVAKDAFKYPEGEISDVIEVKDGYILFKVIKRIPSRIPELADVEEKVRSDLMKEKAKDKAKAHADKLAALDTSELVKQKGLSIENTGFFNRSVWLIPKLGMGRDIMGDLPELKRPKVYNIGNDIIIVWINKEEKALLKDMDEEQAKAIKGGVLALKKETVLDAFMDQARTRHKITIDRDKLGG